MTETENLFFRLLRIALGTPKATDEELSLPLQEREWEAILAMAKKQSMCGFIFLAINKLAESSGLPYAGMDKPLYKKFLMAAATVDMLSKNNHAACAKLDSFLKKEGINYCIFKGHALDRYYGGQACLRQQGDIDIWTPDTDIPQLVEFFKARGIRYVAKYAHVGVKLSGKLPVEFHHTPALFRAPVNNARLQKWLQGHRDCSFDTELGANVPSLEFDMVFLLLHIHHHLLFEGVGIRQFVDYFKILQFLNFNNFGNEIFKKTFFTLESFGLRKFAAGSMYIMSEILGLDSNCLICAPDREAGEIILSEILSGGNFGKFDSRLGAESRQDASLFSKSGRALRALRRRAGLISFSPGEFVMSPLWSVWQHFWRKSRKY